MPDAAHSTCHLALPAPGADPKATPASRRKSRGMALLVLLMAAFIAGGALAGTVSIAGTLISPEPALAQEDESGEDEDNMEEAGIENSGEDGSSDDEGSGDGSKEEEAREELENNPEAVDEACSEDTVGGFRDSIRDRGPWGSGWLLDKTVGQRLFGEYCDNDADDTDPASDDGEDGGFTGPGAAVSNLILDGVLDSLSGLFDRSVEWFTGRVQDLGNAIADTAFGLPEPDPEVWDVYDDYADTLKPAAAVALFLAGILKMVSDSTNAIAQNTMAIVKRVTFFIIAVTFFPEFANLLTGFTTTLGRSFFSDQEIGQAFTDWFVTDFVTTIIPVEGLRDKSIAADLFKSSVKFGVGKLTILVGVIMLIPIFVMLGLLFIVTLIKNFVFYILVMAAPLALACYIIPGLSNVTAAWFRGLMASAAISWLMAIEVQIGSLVIQNPSMVAPTPDLLPLVKTLLLVVMLYLMIKTVGAVYKWAFYSYSGNTGTTTARIAVVSALRRVATRGG